MNNNFIVNGRGTGKTRKLLEYAKEHGATVICSNPVAMRKKAESYGIVGLDIRSYYSTGELVKEVVIDEMTNFLSCRFNFKTIGFTQSED